MDTAAYVCSDTWVGIEQIDKTRPYAGHTMCHDEKATNTGERDKERGEKEKRREKKGTINDARKRNYPLNFRLETYVLISLRRGNLLMVNSTNTVKYHVYDHRRDSCDHGRI